MKALSMKKNTRLNAAKKMGGFSLIELAIVVVILGIVAAFVVPQLTGIKDKNVTVQQEYSAMQRTVTQIFDRYFNEIIDETVINNTEIIAAKLQSEAYKNDGNATIYNIFGGTITIEGVGDNGLTFESEKIPTNVCSSLVSLTRGKLPFETVEINGTEVRFSDNDALGQITAACDAVTADNLTIRWVKEEA